MTVDKIPRGSVVVLLVVKSASLFPGTHAKGPDQAVDDGSRRKVETRQ
jgi:hypothetical protein